MKSIKGVCAVSALIASSWASAGIIVTEGLEGGSGDVDNVLSNSCNGNVIGPATTVQGCLNTDHDFLVNFTSDRDLKYITGGGQATLEAVEGNFSELLISLSDPGYTFSKLQLNINASQDGFVNFFGNPGGSSDTFNLGRNGQNKFTITGENFSSVGFLTSVGIESIELLAEDLKQVRLGGVKPVSVPEPATLTLFGLGLLGLFTRRRLKH